MSPLDCVSAPSPSQDKLLLQQQNAAEHLPSPSWLPASQPGPVSAGSRHHMSNMLHSKLAGAWKRKRDTNPVVMEGAAMSFPLRLFLNCLSKAHCPWQQGGLFLDACFTSPRRCVGIGLSLLLPGTLRPPMVSEVCPAMVTAVCFLTRQGTF